MTEDVLLVEYPEPEIAVLTLNRPHRLNALDGTMVEALLAVLDELDRSWPRTKVVVLRGAGRAFCPGVDLKWLASGVFTDDDATTKFLARLHGVMTRLEELRQVVVSADAQLGDEHIRRDLVPGGGGSQRLPRRVGFARAMYLLLTGRRLTGAEAVDWGLACAAAEPGQLDQVIRELAADLARRDANALRTVKSMVRSGIDMPLREALSAELSLWSGYREASDAMKDGVSRFAAGSS